MALGKWFGGAIGWINGGPLGALLGYVIGAMFDTLSDTATQADSSGTDDVSRDNFLFSLLVMSAYVIKADGKVMHSEMEHVRNFLRRNFGEVAVEQGEQILLELLRRPLDVYGCGTQMADHLDEGQRLQLLSYLVGIARADGRITPDEVDVLRTACRAMRLNERELDSLLNLGGHTVQSAYQVIGVSPTATDAEIRKAYKALVLKHHPDRVASLGEDIRKQAEEKLKQINEAYDRIRKERGIG